MPIRRQGKQLTPRKQAEYVRQITGWSREEYRRQRDLLYNRVRNYERISGLERGTIDVAELLARRERGKQYAARTGQEWRPTAQLEAIMQAPASSTGRRISQRARARVEEALFAQADREMGGVINRSKYSAQFHDEIETARREGKLMGQFYYDTALKYARMLESERENVASMNASIVDPTAAQFYHST